MSHSHTHAPGETHSHSHAPQQQQQRPVPPPPDPVLQALIDAQFSPVDLTVTDANLLLCAPHSLAVCADCDVDFSKTNILSRLLTQNPNIKAPPPGQIVNKQLSGAVNAVKEEGNQLYKLQLYPQAVQRYTMAAGVACQRASWENNNVLREELSTVLSNRSAAFAGAHDWISALADAEAVIQIRKNWAKGHLRKAKALRGLLRLEEAQDAVAFGLTYEPDNKELLEYRADLEKLKKTIEAVKAARSTQASNDSADAAATTAASGTANPAALIPTNEESSEQ
ncbi:uncharacterized protein BT62DRAFT_921285 [Guyanagaster necrorhizus]|uniref:Translocation protein sec72 n=1 Tax=Guyanagaster necrorhizus TaxID=856835 RepID=A0A9P7VPV6_9AGAR|nr:uncharacterized protein BT62DRAFT_921285 [Guyanagaster necrorhizus MCA 3950]KAG7444503.1 hypothetical protein BT62DRAFT_921285 [Guyanagaster necrorhizus MCA 3950]